MALSQPFRNSPFSYVDVPQNPIFSFTVTPLSASQPQWCNIFRIQKIGSTADKCKNGCRLPLVGFGSQSNTQLHMRVDNAYNHDTGFDNSYYAAITLPVGYPTLVTLSINETSMHVYFNNTWKAHANLGISPTYGPGILWRSDEHSPACNVALGPISITSLNDAPVEPLVSSKLVRNVTITENPLITFAIRINSINPNNYCSIFRLTATNNNCCTGRDRPYLAIIGPGKSEVEILIYTSANGTNSQSFKFGNFTLGKSYDVAISVLGNTTSLFVNGDMIKSITSFGGTNGSPQTGNFQFWQGDKYHSACDADVSAITFSTTPANGILNLKPNPPITGVNKPTSKTLKTVVANSFIGNFSLPKSMLASFSIKLNAINTVSDCSLLRLTTTNTDSDIPGDRVLYIYIPQNSSNLTVWMDLSYTNSEIFHEFLISELTIGQLNEVVIQVAGYGLEVTVNGTSYLSETPFSISRQPLFGYVSFFQSDSFKPACNAAMSQASFGQSKYGTTPKNNTLTNVVEVPPNATFSFSVFPLSTSQPSYCKILRIQHVGTSGKDCTQGCSMPYVGFNWQGRTQLWIRMAAGYYSSYGTNGDEHPLLEIPANEWSHIVVSVQGQFISIFINGIFVIRKEAGGQIATGVAGIWVSDPYDSPTCNVMVGDITVSGASNAVTQPTFKPFSQNPVFTDAWSPTNTNWTTAGGASLIAAATPGRFGASLSPNNGTEVINKKFSKTGLLCAQVSVPVVNGTVLQLLATSDLAGANGEELSGWDDLSFDFVSSEPNGVSTNYGINGALQIDAPTLSSDGSNWVNYNTYCLYWDFDINRAGVALWFYNGEFISGEGGYYGVNSTTKLQPVVKYFQGGSNYGDSIGEFNNTTSTAWISNLVYTYW